MPQIPRAGRLALLAAAVLSGGPRAISRSIHAPPQSKEQVLSFRQSSLQEPCLDRRALFHVCTPRRVSIASVSLKVSDGASYCSVSLKIFTTASIIYYLRKAKAVAGKRIIYSPPTPVLHTMHWNFCTMLRKPSLHITREWMQALSFYKSLSLI